MRQEVTSARRHSGTAPQSKEAAPLSPGAGTGGGTADLSACQQHPFIEQCLQSTHLMWAPSQAQGHGVEVGALELARAGLHALASPSPCSCSLVGQARATVKGEPAECVRACCRGRAAIPEQQSSCSHLLLARDQQGGAQRRRVEGGCWTFTWDPSCSLQPLAWSVSLRRSLAGSAPSLGKPWSRPGVGRLSRMAAFTSHASCQQPLTHTL